MTLRMFKMKAGKILPKLESVPTLADSNAPQIDIFVTDYSLFSTMLKQIGINVIGTFKPTQRHSEWLMQGTVS